MAQTARRPSIYISNYNTKVITEQGEDELTLARKKMVISIQRFKKYQNQKIGETSKFVGEN